MEGLQATLQQLEAALRQRDVSEASSTEYCDNFCQALMHYAGSRNSLEHGLSLLEVYCLSINCFAAARPHLTSDSASVALVLKRLALSCFELLLSVPQNEIPIEAWLQFHGSVQAAHEAMLQYGSTDLQALVQITGEGGAWSNPALVSLLTGQPTDDEEVNTYLALEGEGFLEMRIKHLEKVGEVEKALILTKACGNCSLLPSQATFRQTFVMQLCQLLPNEDAILEISKLEGKDVLDIICNMETEGDENTAFILCTTYFTQQLQQESLTCSWELTLVWSKLQRRIDGSLELFLERCLQFGAIAKTVLHLLYLIRVIQTETMGFGLPVSIELCVKALQIPKQEEVETKSTICKIVSCLLSDDLEVLRACQLTEFLWSPSQEVFDNLEELYRRPDQKYDEENAIIPNSLRCELLLALKAHWPFDPEFWDWKTLKHYCVRLLGLEPEEEEETAVPEDTNSVLTVTNAEEEGDEEAEKEQEDSEADECSSAETKEHKDKATMLQPHTSPKKALLWISDAAEPCQRYKFLCQICQKEVIEPRLCHHARKHELNGVWTCPVCLQKFESKQAFLTHSKTHLQRPSRVHHLQKKKVKKKTKESEVDTTDEEDSDDLEPGQIPLDPSLVMYYQSTHDPVVLEHILEQAASVPKKQADDDYITFDYISTHYKLQNRDTYFCPATDCSKNFKLIKYLGVHLKNEHDDTDANVKHYMEMKARREKCTFCRRTFMTAHHHRKHRHVHYGERPYTCLVVGCGASFNTTSELVIHKHSHGFQLTYRCELKDCRMSFCDLGQLYHHEAQHFRDAAYTCTSSGCKKFYYSRKEFLKHLSTHGITFTEEDFEGQRKAKRKLLVPFDDDCTDTGTNESHKPNKKLSVNSNNTVSPPQLLKRRHLTHVTVCFDGKKFTCGWEECGKTFGSARAIQKHLKTVHSEKVKAEEKVNKKMEDETCSEGESKETKNCQEKNQCNPSTWDKTSENQDNTSSSDVSCDGAAASELPPLSCLPELSSALTEVVQGLSTLSLNSIVSRSSQGPSRRHASRSKVSQVTSSTTLNAVSPSKATPNKAEQKVHQAEADGERRSLKSESPLKAESSAPYATSKDPVLQQSQTESTSVRHLSTKPYACNMEGCGYASMTSGSLMYHFIKKHGYSQEDVKLMDIFHPLKFKPFKCHICSNSYRERRKLKIHYLTKHNISKGAVDQLTYNWEQKVVDALPAVLPSDPKQENVDGSVLLRIEEVPGEKKGIPSCKNGVRRAWKNKVLRRNCKIMKGASKRFMPNWNLCKSDPEDKFYPCIHEGCSSFFLKKYNFMRHLKTVHRYDCSQLSYQKELFPCNHNGCHKLFSHLSSLYRHYRKVHQIVEDPIPRFKCTYANCNATYHLKSSLLRHTNQIHQNQRPVDPQDLSSNYKFSTSYRKHVFYQRSNQSHPLVVRLQSAHKRDGSGGGCQKKLIITTTSCSPPKSKLSQNSPPIKKTLRRSLKDPVATQVEDSCYSNEKATKKETDTDHVQKTNSKEIGGTFVYRTPEEALQMCQDRCLPVAYPCMVQDCDSVLSRLSSLNRHYVNVHKMVRTLLTKNEDKLYYTTEQLEELIQKKSAVSALPDLARVPNGVLKMEYQAKRENPGGPSLPMSLHSIKTESMGQEVLEFSGEELPADSSVMIGADDVLYGDSNGHTDDLHKQGNPNQEEQNNNSNNNNNKKTPSPTPTLVLPSPLDLSPPSTLRVTVDTASLDHMSRENKLVGVPAAICSVPANPTPTRQPLRRKNSELPDPTPPPQPPPFGVALPAPPKDVGGHSLAPRVFDIAAYKPLGFESSFLKFIQENEDLVKCNPRCTVTVLNPCFKVDPASRRRELFRRNGSVKENNEMGVRPPVARTRRIRPSQLKPLLHPAGDSSGGSAQNLRFILERAVRGCGDQAIKQLQFLRPVVVLERPRPSTSMLSRLPSQTQE